MDYSVNSISDFELLLQKQTYKKTPLLYDKESGPIKHTYEPQEVIKTVYSQVKALQSADCVGSVKSTYKYFNEMKKSQFLLINKLPMYGSNMQEIPKLSKPLKPETQCFLDTQLMNIIDGADAMNANIGMTQEFDTTFTYHDDMNSEKIKSNDEDKINNDANHKDILIMDENLKKVTKSSQSVNKINVIAYQNKLAKQQNIEYNTIQKNNILLPDVNSQALKTVVEDVVSYIDGYSISQEVNKKFEGVSGSKNIGTVEVDIGQDIQRSPSPVLDISVVKRKSKTPSFSVSLETFENFETVAMPLIEEMDFETVKYFINSQIIGKELCFSDNEKILIGVERDKSPVLDFKSEILQIASNELTLVKNRNKVNKESEVLKDEILFSSDEEDCVLREPKSLPSTCPLEVPNSQEAHLDETLYVGFQTASNKSIEVSRDSYVQAQNILSHIQNKDRESLSLTDLVDICDSLKAKREKSTYSSTNPTERYKNKEVESISNDLEYRLKNKTNFDSKIICNENIKINAHNDCSDYKIKTIHKHFKGFMTASNKKINLSDKALERCRKVFKDIDLNEKHRATEAFHNTCVVLNLELCPENQDSAVWNNEHINDKINDVLLLNEFGNVGMLPEKKEHSRRRGENITETFEAAYDKKTTISQEAKSITMNLFHDNDVNITDSIIGAVSKEYERGDLSPSLALHQPSTNDTFFAGFKTANNKEIKISDEALAKTKSVFKDLGTNKYEMKSIDDITSQPSTSNTEFAGFKTANNKNIKISNEALSKTKYVFKDIDRQTKLDISMKANKLSSNEYFKNEIYKTEMADVLHKMEYIDDNIEKAFGVFKIADSKLFTGLTPEKTKEASDHSIEKSKHILSNIIMDDDALKTVTKETQESCSFVDIQTETNKVINVSKEVLDKNEHVFSYLEPIDTNTKIQTSCQHLSENSGYKGFRTASKKPIILSADALAKSKTIFKDIDENYNNVPGKKSNITAQCIDFQKSNKKDIEVPQDVLITSKILPNDINYTRIENSSGFSGFITASNKKVKVSDKALAKCRTIFQGIEDVSTLKEHSLKVEPENQKFQGFQTANKNKLQVSKEVFEKAESLFNNIDDLTKLDPRRSFAGFQTASHKKVMVSQQALAASKQLFEDQANDKTIIDQENYVHPHVKATEKYFSKYTVEFQTGNNKNIIISKDALKKSKKLLIDINKKDAEKPKTDSHNYLKENNDINVDKIIDTQVMNDFEQDVCSEDFKDSRYNKRSGSPILICPKAKKKKKFEAPYKYKPEIVKDSYKQQELIKSKNTVTFREDYKKNKKYTLKDLSILENGKKQNTDPYILNFNLENILDFEFDEDRNDFQKRKINMNDIKEIFSEGIDKKLIPDGWLNIHLKLILWKLMSYEIRFPNILNKICTVRNVIDQLKYRYDKELYNAERSILRKVLEKDDVPHKTMVLCVAGIYENGVCVVSAANLNNIELLLTDGWYFIKATIDNMLSKLVYDGKIVVGSKIVTCGAELVNCEQGVAPWEDTSSVRLIISGNSTRPARWDERLGVRPCTMTSRLAAVQVGGGKVARLRLLVVRVYPRLYVEKLQDGSTVTRSERLEHQYQTKYEAEREAMIEKIYEEVEKEISEQDSQDSDVTPDPTGKRKSLDSGSQIAKLMKTSKDPMEFRAQLTSSQIHLLQDHVSKQRDKYLQAIQDKIQERLQNRNVIPLARGRVVGLEKNGDKVTVTKGMLSIWKPNEEVLEIFKEGSWIEVSNVVPTALRNSEIQLSAGRQSVFRPVKCKEDIFKPYLTSLSRKCYNLKDLSLNPSMATDYNEIDTVGVIFTTEPSHADFDSNKNQFQNVYLADIDKNMICINFWGGIKKFGYENVIDTGQVVYCANLLKRAGNSRKNIPQFRATEFTIFTKTPKNEKARQKVEEMNKKLFGLDRRKFCQDCVIIKQNFSVIRCLNDSENVTPYRFNTSDYNIGKNKVFIDTPVGVKSKLLDFNLTGLDFESTFRHQDTQLSPKSLERKKKVNEKIAKLKMYGEPPPLSPINIINKSRNAANSYKSPLLKNETSNVSAVSVNKLQSVATPTKLPENNGYNDNSEGSPKISNIMMNRTYIKRTGVNPVKLNFETVDHFAEEFDGSPPLSLE